MTHMCVVDSGKKIFPTANDLHKRHAFLRLIMIANDSKFVVISKTTRYCPKIKKYKHLYLGSGFGTQKINPRRERMKQKL